MFLLNDTIDMNGVKQLEFSPDHYFRGQPIGAPVPDSLS